jgi:uncharacterized membrane protein
MNTYQWLLVFHVTGAFLLLGGGAIAAALNLSALGRERPSEILLLYGLIRVAVVAITAGTLLAFVFGLWLVHEAPFNYSYGDGWVIAAFVLLIVANALGGAGGKRDQATVNLARELVASGDAPSPELRARVHDPVSLALSYGSGLVLIAILALMIWKPGA